MLLVATGERHRHEALEAVPRIRPQLNGRPLWLVCDAPETVPPGLVDQVLPHPDPCHTYRDKIPPLLSLPFRRTLFLDTDVALLQPVEDLFALLQTVHVVGCHAPVRWCQWRDPEVPEGFCELNSGVLGLRRCPRVHRLMRLWLSIYDRVGVPFDQAALRSALWQACGGGLRLWVLPPEYNLRTTKPWIAGQGMAVKVLHGRIPEVMRDPLEHYLNDRTDLFRCSSAFPTPLRARILEPQASPQPPSPPSPPSAQPQAIPQAPPEIAGPSAPAAPLSAAMASSALLQVTAASAAPAPPAPVAAVSPLAAEALPATAAQRLFVLGAGRSGTSLLAGLFRHSGLFMGDAGYKPREANPTGFFEDREVNAINEALLAPLLPPSAGSCGERDAPDVPGEGQRWLARLPLEVPVRADAELERRIRALYARGPSCFKDPRFCYTLAAWRQALPEADRERSRYLCVFRDPAVVASSVLQELRTAPYLADLVISVEEVIEVWCLQYRHVLEHHAGHGSWLFIAYEQLLQPDGLERLAAFSGHALDRTLPRLQLQRSRPLGGVPAAAQALYRELLQRAAAPSPAAPPARRGEPARVSVRSSWPGGDQPAAGVRKIFGIGLNKTGTTTLGTCLQILGFRHSSFDLALLEQAVCGDLEPLFQTVSGFDSFEDWPYPLLYEQLDQRFPGSRFVLTRRASPERWLESLGSHALRTDPLIGSRCRTLAYGLPFPQLDPALHLQHYQRHLERVRHYFRDRPADLLEVCWEEEPRWEPLCTFLQCPLPAVPFPHANAAHPPDPDHLRRNTALIAWYRRLRGASLA